MSHNYLKTAEKRQPLQGTRCCWKQPEQEPPTPTPCPPPLSSLASVCALVAGEGRGRGAPRVPSGPPGLTPALCPLLLQLLSKYDPQKEAELRGWIEGLTGLSIGPDFQKGLKDGVILCT